MPATISPVRAEPPVVTNESAQPIAPRTVPGFTAEGQPLPDDQVWGAFLVTNLDKLFEFTGDVPTALTTLQIRAGK